jgi:hypothetical protein
MKLATSINRQEGLLVCRKDIELPISANHRAAGSLEGK